ncbi:MAG TPA: protein kinase [Pyrinomonadaceae bacterium]|nr:protein kinase [Pyrinomonadaceae bacterium]
MTPERWQKIEEVFQAALDLPHDERHAFVAEACTGDADLCAQVESLIAQHDDAGDFIEAPALVDSRARYTVSQQDTMPTSYGPDDPAVGRRIGAYRVVRELGRGGMGAVYLAERDDSEFSHRVAIKLIKRGMDTDFILRRFRNERQILATLDHSHIAKLLDGGTTEDSLPYFVMEYVEGLPIYRFCDENKLTVKQRLGLFRQVCEAIHYAHRRLVIHRDIKPSNILVTCDGVPKLLDFGIAKVLNPSLVADITADPTATSMRLMTPEYASPEQVQGQPVSPATDVYSLGVLLYELLTGHRPYAIRNRAPYEVARVICEEEPEYPSVRVTSPDDLLSGPSLAEYQSKLTELFESRGATGESLRRELSGDLDRIVMKSLMKDPARRYQSAEALRDDISRYLEGQPVSAPSYVPAAPAPLLQASEPPTGEKSLAILPLKLLSPSLGKDTGDEYLGVGLADALITRLSGVRRFVVRPTSSVLRYGDADPLVAGRELGVDYVVSGTIRRTGDSLRISAQLMSVSEGATRWGGRFDEKSADVLQLEDSISDQVARAIIPHLTGDEQRQLHKRGTDSAEAYEAYMRGRYHWNTFTEEGFAQALYCYHQAIALDPDYALAFAGIADYYNWVGVYGVMPFDECSAAAKEAAEKAVALDAGLAEAYSALGFAIVTHDFNFASAERQHQRALELNSNYATAHQWYGFHLLMEGRFDEADAEMRRARELDPLTPSVMQSLGWCRYMSGRFDESISAYRRLLEAAPNFAYGHITYAWALRHMGSVDESVAEAEKAVEIAPGGQFFLTALGASYAAAGRESDARRVLSQLKEMSATRYVSPYHLSLIHVWLGERERALSLLEKAQSIGDGWLVWLAVEPQFNPLRDEPRFNEILKRTLNPKLGRGTGNEVEKADRQRDRNAEGSRPLSLEGASRIASPNPPAPSVTKPTDSEEAYQLYVAGRYYATRRTAEGLWQGIERLERAVGIDPSFALAHSELADSYSLLNWYVEPPPLNAWPRALESALNAVAADPRLAEAHASLGFVRFHYERDWMAAESEFRFAIELNPAIQVARRWHALNLSAMGRHEEALAEITRAQELAPRSTAVANAHANILFFAERFDACVAQCEKAMELDPGSLSAHIILRWAYEMKGRCEEALTIYERERAFAGDSATTRAKRAHVLASCGRKDEARAILAELLSRRDEEWVTGYEIAVVYSLLGEADEAFAWLAIADQEMAVGLSFVRVDPRLKTLRSDSRFDDLLRRTEISGAHEAVDQTPR